MKTAEYLKDKLPFRNLILRYLSAFSPNMLGNTITCRLKLAKIKDFIVNSEEIVEFEKAVRQYNVSNLIPPHEKIRIIDEFWCSLKARFPLLIKLSLSMLSIFHGPEVERNFSFMTQTLKSHSARLNVETVSSIQTIKCGEHSLVHQILS